VYYTRKDSHRNIVGRLSILTAYRYSITASDWYNPVFALHKVVVIIKVIDT